MCLIDICFILLWSVLTWAMVLLFWNQFIIWQPISRVVKRLYSHIQLNIARKMMHALCQKEFDGNFRQTAKTTRLCFISINNMKFIHSIQKGLVCFQAKSQKHVITNHTYNYHMSFINHYLSIILTLFYS